MANPSIKYGASIRKLNEAIKKQKIAKYKCEVCGEYEVKRISTSIWKCRHCGTVYAGGAYSFTTPAGESARRIIANIAKEQQTS
ncbi:MAG: 50S ribosomal protein L37ae [Candidatus Micrarchaeia archaeon]